MNSVAVRIDDGKLLAIRREQDAVRANELVCAALDA